MFFSFAVSTDESGEQEVRLCIVINGIEKPGAGQDKSQPANGEIKLDLEPRFIYSNRINIKPIRFYFGVETLGRWILRLSLILAKKTKMGKRNMKIFGTE